MGLEPITWMKRTFEKYRDLTIRLVCLPLPPTPVRGVMYMPDSFSAKSFDTTFDRSNGFNAVTTTLSRLGPAVLAYIKLRNLIAFGEDGLLRVEKSTCCATVSYNILRDTQKCEYATETVIDNLNMMSRSCHPGSHYVVPQAPYLTAFLQYAQAPENSDGAQRDGNSLEVVYMTPEEAEILYQDVNFSQNAKIDSYIRSCVIDTSISFLRTKGGLGRWSTGFLATLRRNILEMEGSSYEQWTIGQNEVPRDAGQKDDGPRQGDPACDRVGRAVPQEEDRDHGGRGPDPGGRDQQPPGEQGHRRSEARSGVVWG